MNVGYGLTFLNLSDINFGEAETKRKILKIEIIC